ncbi:hypothetical protein ABVT39_003641 [Epinephelus coioides]
MVVRSLVHVPLEDIPHNWWKGGSRVDGLVEMKITTSNRGLREVRFQCCLQGISKVVDDKLRAPIVVGYSSDGHFDSLKYLPVVSNGSLLHKHMNKRQYTKPFLHSFQGSSFHE